MIYENVPIINTGKKTPAGIGRATAIVVNTNCREINKNK